MACFITEKCIGCTLCAKNCPVMAITGHKKEQHEVAQKRCIDCEVCGRVCPQAAVINKNGCTIAKKSKAEWQKPKIERLLCSACSMCVDGCRFDCLKISLPVTKGDLRVYAVLDDAKTCVGCGYCERLCPMNAISMEVMS
ncbi:MAG: 4Fe-4S binding protein [Eubacterium sp.]